MASIEELRRQQSEQEAAFREQRKLEKDMRKAQKGIRKAKSRELRSRARQAAKDADPDAKLVLVWNGRPIAVREVERPARIVRSDSMVMCNVTPDGRVVRNVLPGASRNARPAIRVPEGMAESGRVVFNACPQCNGCCNGCGGCGKTKRRSPAKTASKKAPTRKTASKGTAKKATSSNRKPAAKKAPSKKAAPRAQSGNVKAKASGKGSR